MSRWRRLGTGPDGQVRTVWKLLGFALVLPAFGVGLDAALRLAPGLARALPCGLRDPLVVLAATALCLRLEGRPLSSLGLRLDLRWARDLALGLLLACAMALASSAAVGLVQGGWVRTPLGPGVLVQGLGIWLGVALFEELACRGFPFQRMAEAWGGRTAQTLMALAFAGLHVASALRRGTPTPTLVLAALSTAGASLLFGRALLATRSLALPVGLHLGWNWMLGTVLGLPVSGTFRPGWLTPAWPGPAVSWATGGWYGPEAGLPVLLALAGGMAVIAFLTSPPRPRGTGTAQDPEAPPTMPPAPPPPGSP